ncbi:MAG: response regulator [Gallionella sp.]|jgi:CheY-like chemotaxis protein
MDIVDKKTVLIVDDDSIICEVLNAALDGEYNVITAHSGEECLSRVEEYKPVLIILDIDMEGMNGYDTCIKLRAEQHTMPVIFLSSCDSLDERLKAFDAGGDDFLSKPTDNQIILRKVQMAIQAKAARDALVCEKDSFESMAMIFLDSMGESGTLQNYTRANFECPDYKTLLDNTLQTTRHLGLECHIQLRLPDGSISCTPNGQTTGPLEESILTQASTMGRLFQFKKRLVTNFENITILIVNMPDNVEVAGRIRDNIAILAEIADAFVKSITLRQRAQASTEKINRANLSAGSAIEILRQKYRAQQVETRMLQHDLIEQVEKTYIYLGLTDKQEQLVTDVMKKCSERILELFEQSDELEKQFSIIADALKPESTK